MSIPKFKQNNTKQCWSCIHRDGLYLHELNGYLFYFPYCKVAEKVMIEVYEKYCDAYKRGN